MKKVLVVLLMSLVMLMGAIPGAAAAVGPITIEVNGSVVKPDAEPYVVDGVTMVPLRFVSEPIGAAITWDQAAKTAGVYRGDLQVEVVLGNRTAQVNGAPMEMLRPADSRDGRIFVPLRFIAEGLGAQVNWLSKTATVTVDFPGMARGMKVSGYYYDYHSLDMLKAHTGTFSDLVHFAYRLTGDGTIADKDNFYLDKFENEGQAYAQANGLRTLMLVTAFDRAIADQVLSSPELRAAAVADICRLVEEKGHHGVDLDFEAVSPARREDYPAFVRELKAALGPEYVVSISVTCRNNDAQTWKDGYDYAALAEAADQMLVMFYDQHYGGGSPGPIAGANWMEESILYLLDYIPKDKFHAGLGAYGRNWIIGGSGSSTYIDNAFNLAASKGVTVERDAASGVPWFKYTDDEGQERVVWFEDAQSMAQKAALAKKYNLAGIAVWRMGIVPDDVWLAIVNAVK